MAGLLSVIANVIAEKNINITHAKISTLGEKINDIFYLTTPLGDAITDQATLDALRDDLVQALEAKKAA
jgi:[protein-PII] uridylyltransferase